jgi:hypothetical protein
MTIITRTEILPDRMPPAVDDEGHRLPLRGRDRLRYTPMSLTHWTVRDLNRPSGSPDATVGSIIKRDEDCWEVALRTQPLTRYYRRTLDETARDFLAPHVRLELALLPLPAVDRTASYTDDELGLPEPMPPITSSIPVAA